MLKDLLVSEVRVKILKLMLPDPSRSLHVRAIVRAVETEINAVRRELARLSDLGLLKSRQSSNRIYYTVDTTSLYYDELLSLVSKETGLGYTLIKERKNLGDIKYAVLSGKFARGEESTVLDVDLFMVGNIKFEMLERIIFEMQQSLGREIHYSVMGDEEFNFRKRKNDQFISRILSQPRIMLVGDSKEFSEI